MAAKRRKKAAAALLVLLAIAISSFVLYAATSAHQIQREADFRRGEADRYFGDASDILASGGPDLAAIDLLQSAIVLEPNRSEYHIELLDAYSDRAASIYRAVVFSDWRKRQCSQHAGRITLSPIYLKDDGSLFSMSDGTACEAIRDLYQKAQEQYAAAKRTELDSGQEAFDVYNEALCNVIFSDMRPRTRFTLTVIKESPFLCPPTIPSDLEILKEIKEATVIEPTSPLYWQAAGDIETWCGKQEASQCYRTAVALGPENESAWLRLAACDVRNDHDEEVDIQGACDASEHDSLPMILLAGCILKQAHFDEFPKQNLNSYTNAAPIDEKLAPADNLAAAKADASVMRAMQRGELGRRIYRGAVTPELIWAVRNVDIPGSQEYPEAIPTVSPTVSEVCFEAAELAAKGHALRADSSLQQLSTAIAGLITEDHFANGGTRYEIYAQGLTGLNLESRILRERVLIAQQYGSAEEKSMAAGDLHKFRFYDKKYRHIAQDAVDFNDISLFY